MDFLDAIDEFGWAWISWLETRPLVVFIMMVVTLGLMLYQVVSEFFLIFRSHTVSLRNNFTVMFKRNCLCSILVYCVLKML